MAIDRRETKAGVRWRARYRAADGRERSQTFELKADAQRWLAAARTDAGRGAWVDPNLGRMTFAAWADRWQDTLTDLRATTEVRSVGIVRNRLVPRFGRMPLAELGATDVKAMIADDLADGYASATARKHVLVLRGVLEEAVTEGRIARNPVAGVKLPPEASRPMRFLTAGQVRALVETFGEHYRPLVWTAAFVGLRWGELAGLRIDRLDLLRARLTVDQQLTEVRGRPLTFGPPKTKAGTRTVTVPGALVDMLAEHVASDACQGSGLVFPTLRGRPMRRSNFRRRWVPRVEGLFGGTELEGLVFHELRHTAAALAIAQGAHPLTIKERLGHASITVTMDRYGHLFPAQDEALAEALDGVLRGALDGPVEGPGEVVALAGGKR